MRIRLPSGVLVGVSRLLSTLRSVFVRVLDRILTVSGPGCQLPVLVRRSDGGEDCSQALVRFVGGSYWVSVICGPPAFHPRVRSRMLPFGFQSRNPSVGLSRYLSLVCRQPGVGRSACATGARSCLNV